MLSPRCEPETWALKLSIYLEIFRILEQFSFSEKSKPQKEKQDFGVPSKQFIDMVITSWSWQHLHNVKGLAWNCIWPEPTFEQSNWANKQATADEGDGAREDTSKTQVVHIYQNIFDI